MAKRIVTGIAIGAASAIGIGLWARYLALRQRHWRGVLADAIPVHSLYWREQTAATGELVYVAIGDSAAQGIGASRPANSYVGVLARHIRDHIGHPVRVVNLGISGATVRIAIDSELPRLNKLQPDILTVSIGANDMANFDEATFRRDIHELFAALPSHAIVADIPSFYFLPAGRHVRIANRIVRETAAEFGLAVVPLHARTDVQGIWGVSTQFAGDLFHPNDRGYRVWASAFRDAVDERLSALR
jgi:lysophospholipase L1-like esterase